MSLVQLQWVVFEYFLLILFLESLKLKHSPLPENWECCNLHLRLCSTYNISQFVYLSKKEKTRVCMLCTSLYVCMWVCTCCFIWRGNSCCSSVCMSRWNGVGMLLWSLCNNEFSILTELGFVSYTLLSSLKFQWGAAQLQSNFSHLLKHMVY